MRKYITKSAAETRKVAQEFAESLLEKKQGKNALVVGLTGELGAGKTTFVKAFMRSAGVKRRITSPTFLILRRFAIKNKNFRNIFHVDAYRIEKKEDLAGTKATEAMTDPKNIVLAEWAEKIKEVLPRETIWVKFTYGKERNERKVVID